MIPKIHANADISERNESACERLHHFVIHCAAIERVGMSYQCDTTWRDFGGQIQIALKRACFTGN
jgi:hypothetical protein